jgi:hypothetical protein
LGILKFLALAAAAITGFLAAWRWHEASKIPIEPDWPTNMPPPAEFKAEQAGWTTATATAFSKSAELNRRAARWTAWSIGFSATAAILGELS